MDRKGNQAGRHPVTKASSPESHVSGFASVDFGCAAVSKRPTPTKQKFFPTACQIRAIALELFLLGGVLVFYPPSFLGSAGDPPATQSSRRGTGWRGQGITKREGSNDNGQFLALSNLRSLLSRAYGSAGWWCSASPSFSFPCKRELVFFVWLRKIKKTLYRKKLTINPYAFGVNFKVVYAVRHCVFPPGEKRAVAFDSGRSLFPIRRATGLRVIGEVE